MQEKVVSKGYTFKVKSYENDGDNYATNFYTVESLEEAKLIKHICETLFQDVGNTIVGTTEKIVKRYVKNNFNLFESIESPLDFIYDLSYDLLGSSEYCDFRALNDFKILYSDVDIFVEQVELN